MTSPSCPNEAPVLRSALEDEDWTVRVTAILVAARLRATDIWLEIKRAKLPESGSSGLNYRWRSLLSALRKAVLSNLANEPMPSGDTDEAVLMRHLRHVAVGDEDGIHDEIRAWVDDWLSPPETS